MKEYINDYLVYRRYEEIMQKYGMTKTFPIDYSKSVEIFEKYGDILKRNQCYMNVWKLFNKTHMFDGWNVSICFGYSIVTAYDSTICVEHAFLITKENEILDITCQRKESKYFVLASFTAKEYLNYILQSQFTDLSNLPFLKELRKDFEKQAKQKNYICVG